MATFKAEAAFIITGRGLAWVGVLTEGNFKAGDTIVIEKDGSTRRRIIKGFGWGRGEGGHDVISIDIACVDDFEMQELRQWDIEGKAFPIEAS